MEREEANTILHKMSKVIDNNQMVKLNIVLEELLKDATLDAPLKSSEENIEAFLSSKRLEGRSEKTLSLIFIAYVTLFAIPSPTKNNTDIFIPF